MYQNIRTIKVGTFNLMNFMLPERAVYNGTLSYSRDEYRRKSEWVEFMLNQMDADIIGFQELFHREALVRIVKNNPHYRNARVYMAEETGDQPSVALLSRYPVENLEVFTHYPEEAVIDFNPKGRDSVILPFTTFTRPVIKADIRIKDYGLITVFVVHLKSKREIFYSGEDAQNPVDLARAQSRSLMLRASESVALRALVAKALEIPDRPVILCGDVNDTGDAVTSRIISGNVPQHKLSDSVKRRIWDLLLYHVKDIQARRSYQDFYYTHIHNGMYESLDHIMVSQELVTEYPRNTGRVGLVSVYNDHLVDQTFTQHGPDKCKSDHGVVVCSLELDLDRAEKYMKDNDGHYSRECLIDPEAALNSLDDEPAPVPMFRDKDQKSRENAQPRENDASQNKALDDNISEMSGSENEKFCVQNSLDRWKRNHPMNGKSRNDGRFGDRNRDERRSFSVRNRNEKRHDESSRGPIVRVLNNREVDNTSENTFVKSQKIEEIQSLSIKTEEICELISAPTSEPEVKSFRERVRRERKAMVPESTKVVSELTSKNTDKNQTFTLDIQNSFDITPAAIKPDKVKADTPAETVNENKAVEIVKEDSSRAEEPVKPVRKLFRATKNPVVKEMTEHVQNMAMDAMNKVDNANKIASESVKSIEKVANKPVVEPVKGSEIAENQVKAENHLKSSEQPSKAEETSVKPRRCRTKKTTNDVSSHSEKKADVSDSSVKTMPEANLTSESDSSTPIKRERRRKAADKAPVALEEIKASVQDAIEVKNTEEKQELLNENEGRRRIRRHRAPIVSDDSDK